MQQPLRRNTMFAGKLMSLIVRDTDRFMGREVLCLPHYGWGWVRRDLPEGQHLDFAIIDDAGLFRVLIEGFIDFENERRGFFGRITTPKHLLSELLVEGITMRAGEWNFTDNPCSRIDVEIGTTYPDLRGGEHPTGSPTYGGHVFAADSLENLKRLTSLDRYLNGEQDGRGQPATRSSRYDPPFSSP